MMQLRLFIIFLFIFTQAALAQTKQYTKYAQEAEAEGDYYSAAYYYQKIYDKDSSDAALTFSLANSYFNFKAYKKAYSLFEKVVASPRKDEFPLALYHMAMINKYQGNYELSAQQFLKFTKQSKEKSTFAYQSAVQELKTSKFIPRIISDTLNFTVFNLAGINSSDAEFGAVLYNDSTLYYSALRKNKDKEYRAKIYTAIGQGGWWNGDAEVKKMNDELLNSADGTFNASKSKFIFSRCSKLKSCKLVEVYLTDTGWSKAVYLPNEINGGDSSVTHPFLMKSGNKEILLFSSNRAGGKGGMDIWFSEINNGKYSAPKNLGAKINTPGNEITPFYNEKDTSLYFSSDWHPGIGGQDVFRSKGDLKALGEPVNVGVPLNSSRNDQGFSIDTSSNGFLSSTRLGTLSDDPDVVCCSDIYRFEKPKVKKIALPLDTIPFRMEEDFISVSLVCTFTTMSQIHEHVIP
ncbi:MAG: tetratricopeptide repeat protein [Bacteroidetes bacterium]|nr:tetratricopeptide repeat protein [Bacteroidota bacterium]